jgi:hypothetical protein
MMIVYMRRTRVAHGLDELVDAGRRLRDRDPDRFMRLLSLARAYLEIYEPTEPHEVTLARLRYVTGEKVDA